MLETTSVNKNTTTAAEPVELAALETTPTSKKPKEPRKKQSFERYEQLDSDVELLLHVHAVRLLCLGLKAPNQVGLLHFAKLTHVLWLAAKNDDPYAEWRLMELYEHMARVQQELKKLEERCQQRLSQLRGLQVNVYSNPRPFRLKLRFGSPFGFMASYVIADLDYVERQFYTLNRLGIVLEGQKTLTDCLEKMQEILCKPLQWPNTGVTRQDIHAKNGKAQQVMAEFGEVPKAILNKTLKFAFLPKK